MFKPRTAMLRITQRTVARSGSRRFHFFRFPLRESLRAGIEASSHLPWQRMISKSLGDNMPNGVLYIHIIHNYQWLSEKAGLLTPAASAESKTLDSCNHWFYWSVAEIGVKLIEVDHSSSTVRDEQVPWWMIGTKKKCLWIFVNLCSILLSSWALRSTSGCLRSFDQFCQTVGICQDCFLSIGQILQLCKIEIASIRSTEFVWRYFIADLRLEYPSMWRMHLPETIDFSMSGSSTKRRSKGQMSLEVYETQFLTPLKLL